MAGKSLENKPKTHHTAKRSSECMADFVHGRRETANSLRNGGGMSVRRRSAPNPKYQRPHCLFMSVENKLLVLAFALALDCPRTRSCHLCKRTHGVALFRFRSITSRCNVHGRRAALGDWGESRDVVGGCIDARLGLVRGRTLDENYYFSKNCVELRFMFGFFHKSPLYSISLHK